MSDRDELAMLRRLAELEAKERGESAAQFMRGIEPQLAQTARTNAERQRLGDEVAADLGPAGRFAASAGAGMASVARALGGGRLVGAMGLPATKDEAEAIDAPLNRTTAGTLGRVVGMAAPAAIAVPFTPATIPAATVAGGVMGGAMTEGDLADRGMGALFGAMGGGGGQALGQSLGAGRAQLRSIAAQQDAAQAARMPSVRSAMDAGYVLPPNEIRQDLTNSLMNAWGGQIKTKQAASFSNQQNTNRLAAQALNLPPEQLTMDAVRQVRSQAAAAYDNVRQAGVILADPQFKADLAKITSRQSNAAATFPGLANDALETVRNSLDQPFFDSSAGVDALSLLRERADEAFAKGDRTLAKAYRSASNAVESLMERNLAAADPQALAEFRKARQLMAKTYDIEAAMNPQTGDVAAATLAQKQKKKPGRFTGELKQIADAAQAFPAATQTLKEAPSPYSMVDVGFGTAAGLGINPAMIAVSAARPVVRTAALSRPGQRFAALDALPTPANALAALLRPTASPRVQRGLVPLAIGAGTYGAGQ